MGVESKRIGSSLACLRLPTFAHRAAIGKTAHLSSRSSKSNSTTKKLAGGTRRFSRVRGRITSPPAFAPSAYSSLNANDELLLLEKARPLAAPSASARSL